MLKWESKRTECGSIRQNRQYNTPDIISDFHCIGQMLSVWARESFHVTSYYSWVWHTSSKRESIS